MARWPKLAKARESRTFSLAVDTVPKLNELARAVETHLNVQCNPGRIIDLLVRDVTPADLIRLILGSEPAELSKETAHA